VGPRSPSDAVILHFFYTQPFAINLVTNGVVVPKATNISQIKLTAPAGTNLFDPQARRISFVMRGGVVTGGYQQNYETS
jgi:hypothetical protein